MLPLPVSTPAVTTAVPPVELPASIAALAQSAYNAEDAQALEAVFRLARQTWPLAADQIDALAAQYAERSLARDAARKQARDTALATAPVLSNWSGEVELGGTLSTGNTRSTGVYGALSLKREGLRWSHVVSGRIDFQRSNGTTVTDRLNLAWQPGYKLGEEIILYGLGQFERDRFLGFSSRYTIGSGIGVKLITRPGLTLAMYGGPALRRTHDIDSGPRTTPAGRAALAFRWKLAPSISLSEDAALYVEESDESTGGANASATSTIETAVSQKLKARLSYNVQYEKNDLTGRSPVDTTSRMTLVYNF